MPQMAKALSQEKGNTELHRLAEPAWNRGTGGGAGGGFSLPTVC